MKLKSFPTHYCQYFTSCINEQIQPVNYINDYNKIISLLKYFLILKSYLLILFKYSFRSLTNTRVN